MATIKDVSQLAGVSVATVSRAFANPEKVSKTTIKKVMKAADKLNYTPNLLAQTFRTNRTNSIVVIVPDLANQFFSRVLAGIEEVASSEGLYMLLANSHDELDFERRCVRMVKSRRVDGVIQLGSRPLEELSDGDAIKDIPFVHAVEPPVYTSAPSICVDNVAASAAIVSHLIDLGHKNISIIAGQKDSLITQYRLQGYKEAMRQAGLKTNDNNVIYSVYNMEGGYNGANRLLALNLQHSAVFCMSDEIAIGALRCFREHNINVPKDISLTGFDNIQFGAFVSPTLTTVIQPAKRLGKQAMSLLIDRMSSGFTSKPATIKMSAELVFRESTSQLK